jgi:hypothetical protein
MAKKRSAYDDGDLPVNQKSGLLTSLKNVGLGALEATGNVLGTPGASVKNLIAGKNPITPWLHPISGEGRVSGRDLLRQGGLIGRKDTTANWWGGFAADLATDPLTFVGGIGALSKAGKLAKAAGGLGAVSNTLGRAGRYGQAITKASELAPHVPELAGALKASRVADEPLRYAFRVGLPFTEGVGVHAPKVFKGMDLLGSMLTKPSQLAPALERGAQAIGLARKAEPPTQAATELVQTYKPHSPMKRDIFIKSRPDQALAIGKANAEAALQKLTPQDKAFKGVNAEVKRLTKEIGRRSAGGKPYNLDASIAKYSKGTFGKQQVPKSDFLPESDILPKPQPVAEWAQKAADALTLPGRVGKMLFHAPTRGKLSESAQSLAETAWHNSDKLHREFLTKTAEKIGDFENLEKHFQGTFEPELKQMAANNPAATPRVMFERLMSLASETKAGAGSAIRHLGLPHGKAPANLTAGVDNYLRDVRKLLNDIHGQAIEAGLPARWLDDIKPSGDFPGFTYAPRAGVERTRYNLSAARDKAVKSVPADIINQVGNLADGLKAAGRRPRDVAEAIKDKFEKWLGHGEWTDAHGNVKPTWPGGPQEHSAALAEWALNKGYPGQTFRLDYLHNVHDYLQDHVHKLGNLWAMHDTLAKTLLHRPTQAVVKAGVLPKGADQLRGQLDFTRRILEQNNVPVVPLSDVFGELSKPGIGKLESENAFKFLAKKMGAAPHEIDDWAKVLASGEAAVPKVVADAIRVVLTPSRL